jgi:hypothetical protein
VKYRDHVTTRREEVMAPMLAIPLGVTDSSPETVCSGLYVCDPVPVTFPGDLLTARLHIDLQRVRSAACPA